MGGSTDIALFRQSTDTGFTYLLPQIDSCKQKEKNRWKWFSLNFSRLICRSRE